MTHKKKSPTNYLVRYAVLAFLVALVLRGVFSTLTHERVASSGDRAATGSVHFAGPDGGGSGKRAKRIAESARRDEAEIDADDDMQRVEGSVPQTGIDLSDSAGVVATQAPRATPVTPSLEPGVEKKEGDSSSEHGRDTDAVASGAAGLLSALQMASEPDPADSDQMVGVRSSKSAGSGAAGAVVAKRETPTPTPEPELPWVSGQARGYAMLYAMQPEARAVVEANVAALLKSRIRQPFISVLIDGTFGQDFAYLKEICRRLSSDERRLTLALYLSNGPTMRVWNETPIRALFSQIEPGAFRSRIVRDSGLREQYRQVVRQARDLFEYNASLHSENSNVAIVMLEDNLNSSAYLSMRDVARQGLNADTTFVRNPCVGCYAGNDGDSLGDALEEHAVQAFNRLGVGDGFSLDGTGFDYPGGSATTQVSSSALLRLMTEARDQGLRYVALWRHGWQGVVPNTRNSHPRLRQYRPSNADEQRFEVESLREGLFEQ